METWLLKKGGVATQNTAITSSDNLKETKPEKSASAEIHITFEPMIEVFSIGCIELVGV